MLGKYFWYQWLFGTVVWGITMWVMYSAGHNSEYINHQKTILAYKDEIIKLKGEQTQRMLDTINGFNDSADKLNQKLLAIRPQIREIRTQTWKEISRPVYEECKMSTDYFLDLNAQIKALNNNANNVVEPKVDEK
jgi:DNA-directed RNA polymerase subunit F